MVDVLGKKYMGYTWSMAPSAGDERDMECRVEQKCCVGGGRAGGGRNMSRGDKSERQSGCGGVVASRDGQGLAAKAIVPVWDSPLRQEA